jgi:hypothetical protein
LTRHERQQLFAIVIGLRLGHVDRSMDLLRQMIEIADTEHAIEDQVNASLERIAKGSGDDRNQRPI